MKSRKEKLIERLEARFDGKNLQHVENEISAAYAAEHINRIDIIEMLFFIKQKELFRQDPVYKKESFATYLFEVHHMREKTFDQEFLAINSHPDECLEWGTRLISIIKNKCQSLKVPQVLKEMADGKKKKGKKFTRSDIQNIIEKHAKVKTEKKPDLKPSREELQVALDKANERIKIVEGENKELRERIQKLVATVKSLKQKMKKLFNKELEVEPA